MSAIVSPCGAYRYRLERPTRVTGRHIVAFIGVNPSTADATADDATVRKWIGFASRWGYGRFVVGNLFGLRATDVRALGAAADPIGPDNDRHLWQIIREADTIIPCWGDRGKLPPRLHGQIGKVRRMLAASGAAVHALGFTKSGDPRHPLMLGYNTRLEEWAP